MNTVVRLNLLQFFIIHVLGPTKNTLSISIQCEFELIFTMKAAKKVGKQPSTTSLLHSCSTCDKAFTSSAKLEQHLSVHTGERPFKCGHCDKSFSSKFKLMRHALIHSNERKYACTYCERCFHRKDHLKNHMQVHNPNKKVHRCEHCSKEYNSRLCFRKHVAIHAAEAGDLNCKVCNKNFTTSEEILYHLKVHAGSRTVKNPNEKKFKCEFCERRFFTRKDVKRHLVVHTGRRDFLCQFCPQRFGRKDHLVRHIKKGHALLAPVTRISDKDANCGESSKDPSTPEFVSSTDSQLTLQSVPCQMPFVSSSSIPSNTLTIPAHFVPGINSSVGFYQVARGLEEMEIKAEPAEDSNERPLEEGNFDFAQFLGFVNPTSDVGEEVPPLPRFSQAFQ